MNALGPPGNGKGALLHAPIPKFATPGYNLARHDATRRCVSCGRFVGDGNLGGHDGRSALTGPVWCLSCADYARQLQLRFGGST
jgi:hypothetical protein